MACHPWAPCPTPDQADLLLTVAVNNATRLGELQQLEFGRRMGNGQQLSIDMPEAGGHVAQELVRMGGDGGVPVGAGVPLGGWGPPCGLGSPCGDAWGPQHLPAAGTGGEDVLWDVSLHLRGAARPSGAQRPLGEQGKTPGVPSAAGCFWPRPFSLRGGAPKPGPDPFPRATRRPGSRD